MFFGIIIIIVGCIIYTIFPDDLGERCPCCFAKVNYLTKSITPAYASVCEECARDEWTAARKKPCVL